MSKVAHRLTSSSRPQIIAHRGHWSSAPENSASAIRAARAFDFVEIDVRLSADGVPVIMHDDTCTRTTGVDVRVADCTAKEITSLTFPGTDEQVPSLARALVAGGGDLFFDLDVKEASELPAVARFMSTRAEKDRCYVKMDVQQSADIQPLIDLQAREGISVVAKHIVRDHDSIALLQEMNARGVIAAEVWFPDLDVLRALVDTGLALTTYTLDEVHCAGLSDAQARTAPSAVWGVLRQAGIRGIMTDEPALLSAYLQGVPQVSESTS